MKTIEDITKHAGVHNLECPNCKRKFSTGELFRRLFKSILELVSSGETVNIAKFGNFRPVVIPGRKVRSPIIPGVTMSSDRVAMKWKMSAHVRRYLNPTVRADPADVEKARDEKRRIRDERLKIRASLEAKIKERKKIQDAKRHSRS